VLLFVPPLFMVGWTGFSSLGRDVKANPSDMLSPATKCLGGTFIPVAEEANPVVKVCGALVGPNRFRSVMLVVGRSVSVYFK
jgi:hypothetical protein